MIASWEQYTALPLCVVSTYHLLINTPTRVIRETAILIDNIFTNAINRQTTAGILVTDITNHFPVYTHVKM